MQRPVLLARVNAYVSERHGSAVTARALRDWVAEGLVPAPRPHWRGKGHGKGEDWPLVAYRRVLQICRLKHGGARRNAQILLALWFTGADYPLDRVRAALIAEYARLRKQVTKPLPVSWDPRVALVPPTARSVQAIVRGIQGAGMTAQPRPGVEAERLLQLVAPLLGSEVRSHDLAPWWATVLDVLELSAIARVDGLPASQESELERDYQTMRGLLADPDESEVAVEATIAATDDATLLNLQGWTRVYPWVMGLMPLMVEVITGMPLADTLQWQAIAIARTSFTGRLTMLAIFAQRAALLPDHGKG